jgi:RNA polymerase-binding transcription factor DksA
MMNRTLAQKARKKLLRRGRELLRSKTSGPGDLAELAELHAALERIERGSYGRCDKCYTEIELDRLESSPRERYCEGCAPDQAAAPRLPA